MSVHSVGGRGPINYIKTALKFFKNAEELLDQGWKEFGVKPFLLPRISLNGPLIILGREYVDTLRLSDDSIVSPLYYYRKTPENAYFYAIVQSAYFNQRGTVPIRN
jgi:hypothetical protein